MELKGFKLHAEISHQTQTQKMRRAYQTAVAFVRVFAYVVNTAYLSKRIYILMKGFSGNLLMREAYKSQMHCCVHENFLICCWREREKHISRFSIIYPRKTFINVFFVFILDNLSLTVDNLSSLYFLFEEHSRFVKCFNSIYYTFFNVGNGAYECALARTN